MADDETKAAPPKKTTAKAPKPDSATPKTSAKKTATSGWIETIVTAGGLLGVSLGKPLAEVAKAIRTKDAATEPNAVLRAKVDKREVTATFADGVLRELAVFMVHTKEDAHKADFKDLKAHLTARHGKAKGKPAFPSWRVEGPTPYRLWLSSWKSRASDFGKSAFYSKIVMDTYADAE